MMTLEFLPGASKEFPDADALVRCRCAGSIVAHCRLWWKTAPLLDGKKSGVLGAYEAESDSAAAELLKGAFSELLAKGMQTVIGPMNGSTWRSYRWVTEVGSEPPFFLEPRQPLEYVGQFRKAGFVPLAEYFSALADDLSIGDERLERAAARLAALGVTLRTLDLGCFEEELRRIYEVSVVGFADNFLYTPLPWEAFRAIYQPLSGRLDARLIWLAEWDERVVGYVFGFPDYAASDPGRTMILKTVVALPERKLAGLGALLVGKFHEAAKEVGARRVIHALMHESNNSRNLSGIYAKTMRRYTLFAANLCGLTVR